MRRRRTRGLAATAGVFGAAVASAAHAALPGYAEGGLFWLRWAAALGLCLLLAIAGAYALKVRQSGGPVRPGPGVFGVGAFGKGRLRPGSLWAAALRATVTWPPGVRSLDTGAVRRLRVIESLRVSAQLEVCLLECDDRELLLATTAQGVVLLKDGPKIAR